MKLTIAAAQVASAAAAVDGNIRRHLEFAALAAEHGVDLIVFPELSLSGYELDAAPRCVLAPDDLRLQPLATFAAGRQMTIVVGAPIKGADGALHIGAMSFLPDGSRRTYAKEYVHESEQPPFRSGRGGPYLLVAGTTVGIAICRDAMFPEHAFRAATAGAGVYAASVMIDEAGYDRKAALLQDYAVRHGFAVLMANYAGCSGGEVSAGRSAVWAETGEQVAAAVGNDECLVIASRKDGCWTGIVVRAGRR